MSLKEVVIRGVPGLQFFEDKASTESRSEPAPEALQQQPLVSIPAVIHEWELLRQREEDAVLYWRKTHAGGAMVKRHLSAAQALTVGINILRALPW